jgi:hypothetical protein
MERTSGCSVDLLWTGGWDSTFRLLQLLLVHRVPVTPHYLEDPTRNSTLVELRTMAGLRDWLHARHPHTQALLQPLRIGDVGDVPRDPGIAAALREIRARSYIGDQYAWLPSYCKHGGLDGLELGVHVDDKVQALVRPYATPYTHPCGFESMRVDAAHAHTPEFTLFRYFGFPLFAIDKVGIAREARAAGWEEAMEMTWFCHTPVRGRPCGVCAPCVYTIDEGLAHRVPASRRMLGYVYRRFALPMKTPLRRTLAAWRARSGHP